MKNRLPSLVAPLSIVTLLGWVGLVRPGPSAPFSAASYPPLPQERSGGSEVPCAIPLTWRLARVDPEFDLDQARATAVVGEAAAMWERAAGRSLFAYDEVGGFPIRLVYDERQAVLDARTRRERRVEEAEASLASQRAAILERGERLALKSAEHVERAHDLEGRVAEYNAAVQEINRSGTVVDARRRELTALAEILRLEQEGLAAERDALNTENERLRTEEQDLSERIARHEESVAELEAQFPQSPVEAGEYREAVTREDGRIVSVRREIRLYRFGGEDDLRFLAAHELGHALGLGHTEDPESVMHASAGPDRSGAALATGDLELFQTICPALSTMPRAR